MTFRNVNVSQFSLEAVSTRFYANGRQQCHIRIKILKQGTNISTGMFSTIPLTQEERNTVTTALFSSSLNYNSLPMPQGWNVTKQRNLYELGLINQQREQNQTKWSRHQDILNEEEYIDEPCVPVSNELKIQTEMENSLSETVLTPGNDVPEIIDVYITASTTGIQRIMAKARLQVSDGDQLRFVTFTTNMNSGSNIFNSTVNPEAINPFSIQPNMLSSSSQTIQNREEQISKWVTHHQNITLFRWVLPYNLRIMEFTSGVPGVFYRLGSTHENNLFMTRGHFLPPGHYTVQSRLSGDPGGCIWSHSYPITINMNEMAVSLLHIRGCAWPSGYYTGIRQISFIDNFGNNQSFLFAPEDNGRKISVNRIN